MRRAQRIAGLSDFGLPSLHGASSNGLPNQTQPSPPAWMADDFRVGLEQLCRSARDDGHLSFIGRYALHRQVVQALVTRLQMVEMRRAQAEVFETPLAPLIVVGMPRSGTTYLHRLLSLDPAMRPLRFWQVAHPIAPAGKDKRRRQTTKDLKWIKRMAPELDAKHYLHADEPEECLFLLNPTFKSLAFWVSSPVYSYLDWLKQQDGFAAYSFYRDQLQIFQAEDLSRPLVLKSPVHTGYLTELLAAIPEAKIVFTHRDATAVQGSANSLFRTLFGLVSDRVDVPRMARANFDMLTEAADRAMRAREQFAAQIQQSSEPRNPVVDVRYDDLLQQPIACVERIYQHFGMAVSDAFRSALEAAIEARPQHHFGVHRYSLKEFGLDENEVRSRFARYDQLAAPIDAP